MQDSERSESNNETKNNQELEVENKSSSDSDLSFIDSNTCNGDNSKISTINKSLNSTSSESNFSEKRIASILRENMKLKEMFRNKNSSTRKQLNAIIVLDKEIQQICENYKERFLEATGVINQSKEDNSVIETSSTLNISAEDENDTTNNPPTARELNLIGQLRVLSRQLKESQDNHSISELKLKEIQHKFTVEADNCNKVLKKFQEELRMLKEKISSNPSDLLNSMNEHCKNELEIKYLTELTTTLKQTVEEITLKETENEQSNNCKETLFEIFKCFNEHCANLLNGENLLDECNKVIKAFKNVEIVYSDDVVDDLKSQNDKFLNYKNTLIDDQLQSIKDERNFRNMQIEFLKIYSDYNYVSNKMECLKNQLLKRKHKKGSKVDVQNLAEIEKCLLEEKEAINKARIKLDEERTSIEQEKQNVREERELFDAERISLLDEKELIIEENKDIVNENLHLNREVVRLKKELSSRKDSTSLQEELDSITAQFNEVNEKLKNSLEMNSDLNNEISKMMDKEEEIWAYKFQAEMQQNEFEEMQLAERNFLEQIENLTTEIRVLKQENTHLRQMNNRQLEHS